MTSPHEGDGELHLAFAIPSAELPRWESWLQQRGIAVEKKRPWESGGWSLYSRDPRPPLARTRHSGYVVGVLKIGAVGIHTDGRACVPPVEVQTWMERKVSVYHHEASGRALDFAEIPA